MFMLAAAAAHAARHNATFVMIGEDNKQCQWIHWLKDIFKPINTTIPLVPTSIAAHWQNLGESGPMTFQTIKPQRINRTISGYRQSWKYFGTDIEQRGVRQTFQLSNKYENFANISLLKYRLMFNASIVVGVHMRLGDLLNSDRKEYGYQMASTKFYAKSMEVVIKISGGNPKNVVFAIASDSVKLATTMISSLNTNYNIVWIQGSVYEDFAVLSKCDHSIMSGGTFGFWASWFAKGLTFYNTNFAKPGSELGKIFISKNFYLPSWIPVES